MLPMSDYKQSCLVSVRCKFQDTTSHVHSLSPRLHVRDKVSTEALYNLFG